MLKPEMLPSQTMRIRCIELASEASAYTVDLSKAGSTRDFIAFAAKIEAFVLGDADEFMRQNGEDAPTAKPADITVTSPWIDWAGGDIPVGIDAQVTVRLAAGDEQTWPAGMLRWEHSGGIGDILAYRVVQP